MEDSLMKRRGSMNSFVRFCDEVKNRKDESLPLPALSHLLHLSLTFLYSISPSRAMKGNLYLISSHVFHFTIRPSGKQC